MKELIFKRLKEKEVEGYYYFESINFQDLPLDIQKKFNQNKAVKILVDKMRFE